MAETFELKSDGKIFKGVGMYHLTFNVACNDLKTGDGLAGVTRTWKNDTILDSLVL